ncbi:5'-methylthioadenosine/S-adenosylhomocysteine nucleosidase [Paracoccus sp. S-4012]|uniref:5'-methylthioadenosine/S-adenosylhomocysteine nucleosidase n=1 Tax=Paracoccus sp. S-4012 TaxID=2665648 RepID=UPI0012B14631|nr:5'-methylthioadenosine/S-adenosylhomocysteine nucleosidase [Paracoccus sp. S-4012]MRX50502.1 5'-methylthioadenosine/S-adenosylhomocysteine nucleosidase [Paracoccus sp. S-4012]
MTEIAGMGGRRVLFVMAAELEYGPALRARIAPLITGIGPVEAAVRLTAMLAAERPDLVVSLGSAGSRRLKQGEVYQVSHVAWRDIDGSPLGFPRGQVPFLDLPVLVELPLRLPGLPAASLSTGANVVSGGAYAAIAEDMVDMETYAHLRACQHFGVPMIGLRGISDGADELGHIGDWSDALPVIDARLAEVVDELEAALREGLLD